MANEITVNASLQYANPAANINIPKQFLGIINTLVNIAGKNYILGTMVVPTTAGGTVIPLGGLANVGWAMFLNQDQTNYIDLMTGLGGGGGVAFARMFPNAGGGPEVALFRFTPAITAPAALAHTATCVMQYLIMEI